MESALRIAAVSGEEREMKLTTAFFSSPFRTSFPWKEDNIVRQDFSPYNSSGLRSAGYSEVRGTDRCYTGNSAVGKC